MGQYYFSCEDIQYRKQWRKVLEKVSLTLGIPIILVLFGASVFHVLEYPSEQKELEGYSEAASTLNSIISDLNYIDAFEEYLSHIETYLHSKDSVPNGSWKLSGAITFCWTVMTTIGYGSYTPITSEGKLFTIFYTITTVPLFLASLALISESIKKVAAKTSSKLRKNSFSTRSKVVFVWFFGLSFIFLLSCIYSMSNSGWSYLDAVYFGFVSLSTVGLGDYTPTTVNPVSTVLLILYCYLGMVSLASMISSLQDAEIKLVKVHDKTSETDKCINPMSDDDLAMPEFDSKEIDDSELENSTHETHVEETDLFFFALKTSLAAIILPFILLLVGGLSLSALEYAAEQEELESYTALEREVNATITRSNHTELKDAYTLFSEAIDPYLNSIDSVPSEVSPQWDFTGSTYFSWTIMSTIGYGSYAPSTSGGKIFCIFYIMLSVPVFMVAVAECSTILSTVLVRIFSRFEKSIKWKKGNFIFHCKLYLLWVGAILFLAATGAIYLHFEGWGYLDAIYFSVITLTTVGLGDYTPSVSKTSLIVFMLLSYVGMMLIASMLSTLQILFEKASDRGAQMIRKMSLHTLKSMHG